MGGALAGVTVIDLSRMLPGPYCSMILADHGARVIAIEDKRFMADGIFISPVNRNKDHMTLNLKTKEGHDIFFELIRDVDVLMEGFRPGVTKRLGIDYETVKEINSRIIYCSITGYGQNGPYKDMAGHDVNYLSFAGILDLIGEKDGSPCIPGIQIADLVGGGMNAAIGILLALVARGKSGKGQYIDISMTDGMVGLLPIPLYLFQRHGKVPQRSDTFLSHRYACYNVYKTADERYISIGAVENRFWQNLCNLLGVPEYAPLQYDDSHRQEILQFFRKAFKKRTLDQWLRELSDKDVCWGKVQSFAEVLKDPLFLTRDMVGAVKNEKGESLPVLGIPVKLSDSPGGIRTAPVSFGQSTKKILEELGYTESEIKRFVEKGVV
ncbi:MAG: CoA transferase [Deltaproteobacteria bacterium]|nr:CoA transferase [Deltaproteobacteria bacterium]MBW2340875.1 CoA transferase [Deltaproteobacteria bacterium]